MRAQIQLFLTALMFYTRIPCPTNIDHNEDSLNKSTRYFPLIGWIVGGLSFTGYWLGSHLFTNELAVILSLVIGIAVTGAFHEDGFADFFDGFGGGWTRAKILDIMKDSRVGTYGMVASILLLAIKFYTLLYLVERNPIAIIAVLYIVYHALARGTAIQLSFLLPYAREDELSKAKPIAKVQTRTEQWGVLLFGISPLVCLALTFPLVLVVLIPLALLVLYFKAYLQKWLGGYTGDCLGAIEQFAEGIILLSFVAVWRYM